MFWKGDVMVSKMSGRSLSSHSSLWYSDLQKEIVSLQKLFNCVFCFCSLSLGPGWTFGMPCIDWLRVQKSGNWPLQILGTTARFLGILKLHLVLWCPPLVVTLHLHAGFPGAVVDLCCHVWASVVPSSICKSIILKWRRMKYIWRDFNQDMGLVCCSAELVILTMVEPVYSAVHVVSNHNIPVIGLLNQY